MDNLKPDDIIHGVRQRRKQTDPISCPVCGITIRPADMEHHLAVEVDRLQKLHTSPNRTKRTSVGPPKEQTAGCSSTNSTSTSIAAASSSSQTSSGTGTGNGDCTDPKQCWSAYQKVKKNRQARLKAKTRKRRSDDPVCPICNETPAEEINVHVENCLSRNSNGSATAAQSDDDDESIDVESESFEEYEWAGQTRIRASSLLEGGYAAAGLAVRNNHQVDEDEDLVVDGDDTQMYGQAQFSEHNVILQLEPSNREEHENLYLRKLVVGEDINQTARLGSDEQTSNTADNMMDTTECTESATTSSSTSASVASFNIDTTGSSKDQIIDSLKAKIRELESQRHNNKCLCLICMDEYRKPVVSICCWHVHCEECWLRTLGARKLCPQCNMITSPLDLRRIYM